VKKDFEFSPLLTPSVKMKRFKHFADSARSHGNGESHSERDFHLKSRGRQHCRQKSSNASRITPVISAHRIYPTGINSKIRRGAQMAVHAPFPLCE